jgi:tetratricopeptide (TPR) repeat protein
MIADLGRNDWIGVFAKASTAPLAAATPLQVHEALGADYVVTGTVQGEADRARIAAALVDAETGRQVWAEDWQGPPDDLLALQTAAAEALTAELAGAYTGAIARAGRARAHAKTASLDAFDLYLIGTEHKHRFTPAELELAKKYYLKAVALDPGFAKAWAGLSIAQGFLAGLATTDEEWAVGFAEQRGYIERAVAADPDDPAVLIEASLLDAVDGELDGAARKLRRAVERAPNDADTLAGAAWSGPVRAPIAVEAVAWADRALALNPERPDWYMAAKGQAAFAAGDDATAIAALKQGPKDYLDGWVMMAAAAASLGDPALAEDAVAEVHRISPDFDLAFYFDGWPYEPGFAARLREGAVRAGLGAAR